MRRTLTASLTIAMAALLLPLSPGTTQASEMTAEENAARQAFADGNFEAIMAPQNEAFFNPSSGENIAVPEQALQQLNQLGYLDNSQVLSAPRAPLPAPQTTVTTNLPLAATVEVDLDTFTEAREFLEQIRKERTARTGPLVALGASSYTGRAIDGALELSLTLQVTLGATDQWKTVPLIGDDVVLVKGTVNGKPIPVSRYNGYHVWITDTRGEATIEMEILVPSRGPKGSLEYDFLVAKTPVTSFSCEFPTPKLEPKLDAAVKSEVTPSPQGTLLEATLKPTTRIHLVGFKDMSESEEQNSRVFAESLNLLSVDESTLDLFTVISYTILYSGTKHFDILIPKGLNVVSADGEGAFRFILEKQTDGSTIIRGETAFPIRNAYEVSLRLKRQLPKESESSTGKFQAPLPRCIDVEREHGWLAVEVPGKFRLNEEGTTEVTSIDMRQLPKEMIHSAVSPIIRAYRYHSSKAAVVLSASRLPDQEPASESVDRVRAFSVLSKEGKMLTDMRITMRNRLRPNLTLTLPDGASLRSVHLDGVAIRPSGGKNGEIMLPLKRSEGQDRLKPFTLQVVLESSYSPLGMLGEGELALPSIDLPVSSSAWTIFLPSRNSYSALEGDIEHQQYNSAASWHQPAHSAAPVRTMADVSGLGDEDYDSGGQEGAGLMSVRIELPRTGTRMDYNRYWLEAGKPLSVRFDYYRSWLAIPAAIFLALLFALGVILIEARRTSARPRLALIGGLLLVIAPFKPLHMLGNDKALIAAFALGLGVVALRRRWFKTIPAKVKTWFTDMGERYDPATHEDMNTGLFFIIKKVLLAAGLCLLLAALLGNTADLLSLIF